MFASGLSRYLLYPLRGLFQSVEHEQHSPTARRTLDDAAPPNGHKARLRTVLSVTATGRPCQTFGRRFTTPSTWHRATRRPIGAARIHPMAADTSQAGPLQPPPVWSARVASQPTTPAVCFSLFLTLQPIFARRPIPPCSIVTTYYIHCRTALTSQFAIADLCRAEPPARAPWRRNRATCTNQRGLRNTHSPTASAAFAARAMRITTVHDRVDLAPSGSGTRCQVA